MGRLRVQSRREGCRILRQHGSIEVRRRGGHVVMQRRTDAGSVTIPIPNDREIAIGRCRSSCRAGYRVAPPDRTPRGDTTSPEPHSR